MILVYIIIPVLFFVFNIGVEYCLDDFQQGIVNAQSNINYWQEDLQSLKDIYEYNNYHTRNDSELSPDELQHKNQTLDQINQAQNNVRESIAELKKLRDTQEQYNNAPRVLKRDNSDVDQADVNIDNKRRGV